ncbi:cupredoxin domain-containing protein [Brachybacterium sp. NBEC-018]|uniref:iron uptake system protein EfeO n=1 Tax=Brachybacterium sp. NBEC-018 TaxID=2996004 RepID=UPI002174E067|nr:iron uptake system protein EfeO [Brachybacterium sp. NBEC-018]UVY84763.1 cupredoxin domain-containing protein [Brachybacterium sp. NBEC-018]
MTASSRTLPSRRLLLGSLPLLGLALAACTDNPGVASSSASDGGGATGAVTVTLTDDACELSTASVPSGQVTFTITNSGTVPNEFEILAEDKLRIISEKENIGPGSSVELTTSLAEGSYFTASKPNMVGALVGTAAFTVTAGEAVEVDEDIAALEEKAVADYTAYIKDQVGLLVTSAKEFTDAYVSGDRELARSLFAQGRRPYERIEPTAEAFGIEEAGDLDMAMDARVQDLAADAGTEVTDPSVLEGWTGWHRIEADLFTEDGSPFSFADDAARKAAADDLNENIQTLYDIVYGKRTGLGGAAFTITLNDVVQGAQGLMEEVATGKIVGEEDTFSHTDLDDFQANLQGAQVAYGNVQALVVAKDEALDKDISERFDAVQAELDKHTDGTTPDGEPAFVDYSTIASVQEDAGEAPGDDSYTDAQRAISDAVNALSESLSQVAGTILH